MQGLKKAAILVITMFVGVGTANADEGYISESKVDAEMNQVLHTIEEVQEQLQAPFITCFENTTLTPTECQQVVLLELSEYFIAIIYVAAEEDSYSAVLRDPDRAGYWGSNRTRYHTTLVALGAVNAAVQRYLTACGEVENLEEVEEVENLEEVKRCRGEVFTAVIGFLTEIIPVVLWDVPEF